MVGQERTFVILASASPVNDFATEVFAIKARHHKILGLDIPVVIAGFMHLGHGLHTYPVVCACICGVFYSETTMM